MVLLKSGEKLAIGSKAIDFNLKGTDDKSYSLDSFKDAKALLIVFMCNHCPYVKAKMQVMKELQKKYKDKGLVIIGINSNDPVQYPDDNFENMKKVAEEKGFNFYYLFDETQETAKAYGAVCTPDPFLFDQNRKLAYHGRFNDAMNPEDVPTTNDMAEAIEAVLSGKPVKNPFLYSMGCSIKWK